MRQINTLDFKQIVFVEILWRRFARLRITTTKCIQGQSFRRYLQILLQFYVRWHNRWCMNKTENLLFVCIRLTEVFIFEAEMPKCLSGEIIIE